MGLLFEGVSETIMAYAFVTWGQNVRTIFITWPFRITRKIKTETWQKVISSIYPFAGWPTSPHAIN